MVLYILFLRASFTSNTRWKSQTFHVDENLSGRYLGGFSKSLGLELSTFPDFLNKITIRQITPYITLHNIMFKYGITQKEREMS